MKIKSTWIEKMSGLVATAEYEDSEDFSRVPYEKSSQVICFAFYQGKMLIVFDKDKKNWGPPGGGIEHPESFEDCARRELIEEANVKLITYKPIGFQKAILSSGKEEYQLRVFCEVEPIDEFMSDPDGDVTAIKYIDVEDYKDYFDWGDVGERIIFRVKEMMKLI